MNIWSASFLCFVLFIVLLGVYVHINDRRLTTIPEDALVFSPKRCTPEDVRLTAKRLADAPLITLGDQLPPRTGRRYIVVGGAGFLGGWIVSTLLDRGEDPKRIRMLDIRAPVRHDLKTGKALDVQFFKVDVSDAEAVKAAFSAPWPDTNMATTEAGSEPELTVFHTASNIRFYERHPLLMPRSERVNVQGTKNVIDASRAVGASVLIYTSSGSIGVFRSMFLLWPWQREPKRFVQVIDDDDDTYPKRHEDFFSNYAASKIKADRIVRQADRVSSAGGRHNVLRTGCIRPGNGIFGPRGDMLCGAYLVRKTNPTWIANTVQSFCYVENCALAHLLYERRLIDLLEGGEKCPDIGGKAFTVADPGPIPTYGDVYTTLETLTEGECTFPNMPPTLMLLISYLIETLYLARFLLSESRWGSAIARLLPAVNGDLVNLQPSLFALTSVHLIFDDSRARLPPEQGGLGYKGAWTTLEGLHKTYEEHKSGVSGFEQRSDLAGVSLGWGFGKAQRGVAKASDNVAKNIGVNPVKVLSSK